MKNNHQETDRVRKVSSAEVSHQIDEEIKNTLTSYQGKSKKAINDRIQALEKEWDVERNIEVIAPSLILGGLLLSYFVNKKWLMLPGVVAAFLLQHGLQGWCPPVPLLRAMKIRTKEEIDKEKYALKALRGDFDLLSDQKDAEKAMDAAS